MENIIYNEDCYSGLKKIPDNSIDLIIIDPPYTLSKSGGKNGKNRIAQSILKVSNTLDKYNIADGYDLSLLDELVRVMKNINIYIWCNKAQIEDYLKYFVDIYKCKYEILIWNKTNVMPLYSHKYLNDKEYCLYFKNNAICNPQNMEDARTVFVSTMNAKDRIKYSHPTIKPLNFTRKLIRNSSKENDIVLDCFMGSGTTAVAAILENRKYIGFEVNKEFYDIINRRIDEAIEFKNNNTAVEC